MNSLWTDSPPGWATYGTEQTQNAQDIDMHLAARGLSPNVRYAIIGNLQKESYLNPGQWELGSNYSPSAGFGLGQWTPSTKVSDVTGTAPAAMMDYISQLDILLQNSPNQWSTVFVNSNGWSNYYNMSVPYFATFNDFLNDTTHSVPELTKAYMACWERPAAQYAGVQERIEYANHWAGIQPGPMTITPALFVILAKAALTWRLFQ